MPLYVKARWFMVWIFVLFFTFPLWMSALDAAFGETGVAVGAIFWLAHGGATLFLFRCPDCGLSPFLSNKGLMAWSTPWPRKTCGHCGHDHMLAPDR
jgi:ribosomal protein S27AE